MHQSLVFLSATCLAFEVLPTSLFDSISQQITAREQREIEALFQNPTAYELSVKLRAIFQNSRNERIQELKFSVNPGVGLLAAWEEIRRSVPEKVKEVVRPDPKLLNQLIGFAEGRLRAKLPSWWLQTLLSAEASARSDIHFDNPKGHLYLAAGLERFAPRGTNLAKDGNGVRLTVGERSVTLPASLAAEILEKDAQPNVSAYLGTERCYLVHHADRCTPFLLTCWDPKSVKILWTKLGWAARGYGAWNGIDERHWVSVVEKQDRVIVFGAGSEVVYIEAFNAKDGTVLFRFGTSY
jgi:hypothetical protein